MSFSSLNTLYRKLTLHTLKVGNYHNIGDGYQARERICHFDVHSVLCAHYFPRQGAILTSRKLRSFMWYFPLLPLQAYYINRVRQLSSKTWIGVVGWVMVAIDGGLSLAVSYESFLDVPREPDNFEVQRKWGWLITASLGLSAALDALIAAAMVYYLKRFSDMTMKRYVDFSQSLMFHLRGSVFFCSFFPVFVVSMYWHLFWCYSTAELLNGLLIWTIGTLNRFRCTSHVLWRRLLCCRDGIIDQLCVGNCSCICMPSSFPNWIWWNLTCILNCSFIPWSSTVCWRTTTCPLPDIDKSALDIWFAVFLPLAKCELLLFMHTTSHWFFSPPPI